jgi:hypothetical protein
MSDDQAPSLASTSTLSRSVPNPQTLVVDHSDSVDKAVQRRLARKPSLLSRLRGSTSKKHPKRRSTQETPEEDAGEESIATSELDPEVGSIHLDREVTTLAIAQAGQDGDRYEWAVVYENQRG